MSSHEIMSICKKIDDYKKKDVKEPGTKTGLVEPLFRAIGWDFSDIDSVEPEYPVVLGEDNNPADYALKIDGKVSLFVETKRINEKLAKAIDDGAAKAEKEKVPWLIATNGDALALLRIDAEIPEDERTVFQMTLSATIDDPDLLDRCKAYLWMLRPDGIKAGELQTFADRKLKEVRIYNTIEAAFLSEEFLRLILEKYKERYSGDVPDQDPLDNILERLRGEMQASRTDEEFWPAAKTGDATIDPNAEIFQNRRKRLFHYASKQAKASVARNIKEKRELWLEFLKRGRMSTPEFKDYAHFNKKAVAGFAYFLTYHGLATHDGKDKIRGGIILKLNEAIVDEIKTVLALA